MKRLITMWQILLVFILGASAAIEVAIPGLGAVCGTVVNAPARDFDVDVWQFTGIPFAQPPVGELRFAAPQPITPWAPEIINATKSSPSCMQLPFPIFEEWEEWHFYEDFVTQEDCLYLNVWVPKRDPNEAPFPVMVWIHGGGFVMGSISTKVFTGDVLAAVGNVVVVSINYRLGTFGFAHLADPEFEGGAAISGNLGLLDQQLGLRWVKDHIRSFGGDPNLVTIFGESAGGASVTAHLAAPGSADLFARAISQSGSLRDPWAARSSPFLTNITLTLAETVGCMEDTFTTAEILRCLKTVDAEIIQNATDVYGMLMLNTDTSFFNGSAFDRIATANLSEKSIMMGHTFDEHRFFLLVHYRHRFSTTNKWVMDRVVYNQISIELLEYISDEFNFNHNTLDGSLLWHYDNATAFGNTYLERFTRLGTDYMFACPAKRIVTDWLVSKHNRPENMYLYIFNQSLTTLDGLGWEQMKAFHAADVSPTFGEPLRNLSKTNGVYCENEDSIRLRDGSVITNAKDLRINAVKIIRFWTNFAKFGNPNGNGSNVPVDGGDSWLPTTDSDSLVYRVLQADDSYSRMIPDQNKEDCAFWKEIFHTNKRLNGKRSEE